MNEITKKFPTIGCCGIDCALCTRFHTKGESVCPGCGGKDFGTKHPSCGFLTCCVLKKGKEVCSQCKEFPCSRFKPENDGYDSFVTHRKVFENLNLIKDRGMDNFNTQQNIRLTILYDFLNFFDDGRSKGFFCLCCTLLPPENLQEANNSMKRMIGTSDVKELNKVLRDMLQSEADNLGISLKLNHKK